MPRLWLYCISIAITINCAATIKKPTSHSFKDQLEQIAERYEGVPVIKSYKQIKDFIIKLDNPGQSFAKQAKVSGFGAIQKI